MAAPFPRDADDFAAEPRSMDMREYWRAVRRRWRLVAAVTVLGAALSLGYALYAGPTYSATAEVLVAPVTQGPLNVSVQPNQLVNMSTEQTVAQSAPVIDGAAKLMGTPSGALQAAAGRLTVTIPSTSPTTTSNLLQMTWRASTARAAQRGADAFANAYLAYRHAQLAGEIARWSATLNVEARSLQKRAAQLSAQVNGLTGASPTRQNLVIRLSQTTSQLGRTNTQLTALPTVDDSGGRAIAAALPLSPASQGPLVLLALGAIIGLLAGFVLAFIRDVLDDRVHDPAQLEAKLAAATIGVLPPASRLRRRLSLATVADPYSHAAEAVRALRATLSAAAARAEMRSILVVAADSSVSASRITAELGVALAESGRRVLLVAADLRGSVLPQIFDIPDNAGLTDLLVDGGDPEIVTRQPRQAAGLNLPIAIIKRLAVLTGGSQPVHALSVLDSDAMVGLLRTQSQAYEFVVLDCPPATLAADVIPLAARIDGVIVLAREGRTSGRVLDDLRHRLDRAGAQLVGGVLISRGQRARRRYRRAGPVAELSVPGEGQQAAWQGPKRPLPVGRNGSESAAAAPRSADTPPAGPA